MEHKELTEQIIGCAMKVQRTLGFGFLESVYKSALCHELMKLGIGFEREKPVSVNYDGLVVGEFFADILVQDSVIIETKSVQSLIAAHEVQLVNYLTATRIEIGLLLNFGPSRLEFKRKNRTFKPKHDEGTLRLVDQLELSPSG